MTATSTPGNSANGWEDTWKNFWDNLGNFSSPSFSPKQDSELLKQLNFVPGLKELLMVRQVHALEHATVWVLSDRYPSRKTPRDNQQLGGLSTDQGFYLYGPVNLAELHTSVRIALQRLNQGEWSLAIHPRCGTNLSVSLVVTAGLAFGFHLILPRDPMSQILGLGLAATTANQVTPDLGRLAQQFLTTSIPFNLALEEITPTPDLWGRPAHFVRLRWIDR